MRPLYLGVFGAGATLLVAVGAYVAWPRDASLSEAAIEAQMADAVEAFGLARYEDVASIRFSSCVGEVVARARNWVSGQRVNDFAGRAVHHDQPFR